MARGLMPLDPETQHAIDALRQQLAQVQGDVQRLTSEVAEQRELLANVDNTQQRLIANGLSPLLSGSAFEGAGGALGDSKRFKRADAT